MKKIMISMPMANKNYIELLLKYQNYKRLLMEREFKVINTLFRYEKKEYINMPIFYLSKAIQAMSKCDAVFFAKGWQKARGCKIEHEIAKQYGLELIYEKE